MTNSIILALFIASLREIENGTNVWNKREEYGPSQIKPCIAIDYLKQYGGTVTTNFAKAYLEKHYEEVELWHAGRCLRCPETGDLKARVQEACLAWKRGFTGRLRPSAWDLDYRERFWNIFSEKMAKAELEENVTVRGDLKVDP